MMQIRKITLITLAVLVLPFTIAAQNNVSTEISAEPENSEAAIYIDFMFNRYIELEDSILDADADLEQKLYEIRKFRVEVEQENRRDILSRLDMLDFIIRTKLDNEERTAGEESIKEKILSDEELRLAAGQREAGEEFLKGAAVCTTFASAFVFLATTGLYEDYYSKYTATDSEDDAAFYLFWWQIFKTTSIISGFSTAAAAVTSAIFSITF